jgi:hypothetical protein
MNEHHVHIQKIYLILGYFLISQILDSMHKNQAVKCITRIGKYHIQKIKQILEHFLISQISGGSNEEPSSEITNVKIPDLRKFYIFN